MDVRGSFGDDEVLGLLLRPRPLSPLWPPPPPPPPPSNARDWLLVGMRQLTRRKYPVSYELPGKIYCKGEGLARVFVYGMIEVSSCFNPFNRRVDRAGTPLVVVSSSSTTDLKKLLESGNQHPFRRARVLSSSNSSNKVEAPTTELFALANMSHTRMVQYILYSSTTRHHVSRWNSRQSSRTSST